MSPINVPESAKDFAGNPIGGNAITLPFIAPLMSWRNGNAAAGTTTADALHFGGWECSADRMEEAIGNGFPEPSRFSKATIPTRDGSKTYEAYVSRSIAVAIIASRHTWSIDPNKPGDKGRGWRQIIGYMADIAGTKENRKLIPWGPVVLSAKGLSCLNIEKAIAEFDRKTRAARIQFASKAPAWVFYIYLGTFSKERVAEMVGPKGQQSPITPCQLFIPEKVDEKFLESVYVGDTVLEIMRDHKEQAAEWLAAWKDKPQDQRNLDFVGANPYPIDEEPPYPDDPSVGIGIPF